MIDGCDDDEMDVSQKRKCCRSQNLDVEKITQIAGLHRGGKERLGGEGCFHTRKKWCSSQILAEGGVESDAQILGAIRKL